MKVSDFTLEAGIPMPQDGPDYSRYKYPWRQMRVGDSFFVPAVDDARRKLTHIRSLMYHHNNKHPEHFEARIVDGGVRVWRTG